MMNWLIKDANVFKTREGKRGRCLPSRFLRARTRLRGGSSCAPEREKRVTVGSTAVSLSSETEASQKTRPDDSTKVTDTTN